MEEREQRRHDGLACGDVRREGFVEGEGQRVPAQRLGRDGQAGRPVALHDAPHVQPDRPAAPTVGQGKVREGGSLFPKRLEARSWLTIPRWSRAKSPPAKRDRSGGETSSEA